MFVISLLRMQTNISSIIFNSGWRGTRKALRLYTMSGRYGFKAHGSMQTMHATADLWPLFPIHLFNPKCSVSQEFLLWLRVPDLMSDMSSFMCLLPLSHHLRSVGVILVMVISGSVFILRAWSKNTSGGLHIV